MFLDTKFEKKNVKNNLQLITVDHHAAEGISLGLVNTVHRRFFFQSYKDKEKLSANRAL
jgi:hypothetical protein